MSKKTIILLAVVTLGFAFDSSGILELTYPEYFPEPVYDLKKNPLTSEKIRLGRALFYDNILSADNTVSCASCHSPYNAFAHSDHDLSHGIGDQIGTRNAPALMNLAWHNSFMWDGAINHLDMQALAPISHPKEMGDSITNVISKLQHSKIYPKLFQEAYQDSVITGEYLLKALSQFQLTLVSSQSKYDDVKLGKDTFSTQEMNGYKLFSHHCNSCHTEPLFTNHSFKNNGLEIDTTLNDYGRMTITSNPADSLKFKVPTLRNLSFSSPYMHDGRLRKLSHVIKHYTSGLHDKAIISDELKKPIVLTSNEKVDLLAFLLTLDDKAFVFNPAHQFPREILLGD